MTTSTNEMTFWDHLEDLRKSVFRMAASLVAVTVVLFFFKDFLFDDVILAPTEKDFYLYRLLGVDFSLSLVNIEVSAQFMIHMKVTFICALILTFPYLVYELWNFVAPALYERELPYFALDEEAWSLWGLRLFRNCERLTLLDRSESVIYTMVNGSFGSGMADVVVDSVRYSALFRSCKRKVCLDGDVISVRCKLLLDSEIRPPIDEKTLTRAMSESAGELCRQLMERYGDVFGIADAMDIGGEELESVDVRVVFE